MTPACKNALKELINAHSSATLADESNTDAESRDCSIKTNEKRKCEVYERVKFATCTYAESTKNELLQLPKINFLIYRTNKYINVSLDFNKFKTLNIFSLKSR